MENLLIRDVRWSITTAGPSPFNNERTELFLLGCKKAMMGNPCKGCFNQSAWDSSKAEFSHTPAEVADTINKFAPNKYITISGGEPTDQIKPLIELCRRLKEYNFNIMVYTWKRLKYMLDKPAPYVWDLNSHQHHEEYIGTSNINNLLNNIDILVDGQYIEEEKLWNGEKADGFISSIGSGNQIIWDINNKIGYAMRDIKSLHIEEFENKKNKLIYKLNDNAIKLIFGGEEEE